MYDYGARFYMPDIGRWGVVDPLADVHPDMTPFRYSFNNPINATDPTGLLEDWYNDSEGNVSWHNSQEDQLTGSNGESLSRLGKSGSYLNASGSVTTLNEDATVTQGGNTSILLSPEKMSSAAMGGDVINTQGSTATFAAFDTTKYGTPGPFKLQSPALTDPSAAMFRFYAEGLAGGYLLRGFGRILSYESVATQEMTTVGRWMSQAEYGTMSKTGQMVEGAGGQTFVTTGGANSFTSASKGSVYAEFQVSSNSLLQGGKEGWFKAIGPNAGRAMQGALQKQGGQLLPQVKKLSPVLQVK